MIRYCIVLAVALASGFFLSTQVQAESVTALQISIQDPSPPITTSDVIQCYVRITQAMFPSTDYVTCSSFSIDGLHIDWNIVTERGGAGLQVLIPMVHANELGPLPAGNYELTATWTYPEGIIPSDTPLSGVGATSFSVVPEPSILMMFFALGIISTFLTKRR